MRARWKRAKRRHRKRRQTQNYAAAKAAKDSLYEPLPSQSSIRLITLQPGDLDDPIRCTLEVVELASAPSYEAMSYVWGDLKPKRWIRCNGRRVLVRDNLNDAIRNVRLTEETRVVWIDALCINQSSLGERSHQVLLMRDIYTRSRTTLICLDIKPSINTGEGDWTFMAYLAVLFIAGFSEVTNWNFENVFDPWYRKSEFPPLETEQKSLLKRLFSCKWFQRVWVIQEAVLSTEAIFVVNREKWNWRALGLAAYRLQSSLNEIPDFGEASLRGIYQFGQVWAWTSARRKNNVTPNLLDTRTLFSLSLATDPRDLIYGLLGISKEQSLLEQQMRTNSSGIIPLPNYGDSLRDVFTDWCRYFIESTGELDMFSHTLIIGVGSTDDHLSFIPYNVMDTPDERAWTPEEACFPSWVPYWHRASMPSMNSKANRRTEPLGYRASSDHPLRLKKSIRRDTIIPRGVIFDTVKWIGEIIYRKSFYPGLGMLTKDHAIIRNYLRITGLLDSYPNGDTVHNAYAIVAAAGNLQQKPAESTSSPGMDMLMYCAWVTARESSESRDITIMLEEMQTNKGIGWNAAHADTVQEKCSYRRFFITNQGYLGLGAAQTEVEDQVCVLFGGKTPFMLRKVSGHFKLIGESYIHGIMDGEVVQQLEAGELSEQWFEIR